MTISYTLGIPNGPNNPSNDQPNMKINNDNIASYVSIDHVAFNTNNSGKHLKSTYESNIYTLSAAPTTVAGEVVVYAANTTPGNVLAIARDGSISGIQLTTATTNPISSSNGCSWLPGGLLLQWGQATSSGVALPNTTVTFPVSFSSSAYSVNCTIITTSDSRFFVEVYDMSNNQFRAVTRDSGGSKVSGVTFNWMAIGPVV